MEPPVEHFLLYAQLQRWLDGGAKSPAEAVMREAVEGDVGELMSLDSTPVRLSAA